MNVPPIHSTSDNVTPAVLGVLPQRQGGQLPVRHGAQRAHPHSSGRRDPLHSEVSQTDWPASYMMIIYVLYIPSSLSCLLISTMRLQAHLGDESTRRNDSAKKACRGERERALLGLSFELILLVLLYSLLP